jgi:hypothetical protein
MKEDILRKQMDLFAQDLPTVPLMADRKAQMIQLIQVLLIEITKTRIDDGDDNGKNHS